VITAYPSDVECERAMALWGIRQFGLSKPEKIINGSDPDDFCYKITGSAESRLTGGQVLDVEGVRSSKEDFCRGKTGLELDKDVSRAARANLDGAHFRHLSGTNSIQIETLIEAWKGTGKSIDQCAKGRGFGTRDERLGATKEGDPDVTPPVCPHCGTKAVYRPKGKPPFYGCPNYTKHPDKKFIVNARDWVEQQKKAAPAPAAPAEPEPPKPTAPPAAPLHADDIDFGGGRRRQREPGEEG